MTENEFTSELNKIQGFLERAALAVLGNKSDAADAVQEAILKAYICREQLRGGSRSFKPWIKRILLHVCSKVLRHRQRVIPLGGREELICDTVAQVEGQSEVWDRVAALNPQLREVVALRYIFDLSQEQVAESLGIPVGTVKSRLNRALEQLRTDLQELGRESGEYEVGKKC